ncbi:4,5-DOPA dioxygenase extradiol [Flavobacterium sp. '19STA2R22 D10 B1']|uniref:4,5-DOPA-extradiol-dioxygenase n=1 Tax=Flavobacterium aerium TaxID=3037261 RepID=UPI00278BD73A|nr:4,5-DOPA dioxygenase extradiol [Flavobacterium sp. '19STA2R22 D10 B1']
MKLNELNKMTASFSNTTKMPVLFLGHGSPMNAIEENEFTRNWNAIGKSLPKPNAIVCISAHWETKGTFVTAMEKPQTIHDFGGFPEALFAVEYPAPGSPDLAKETQQIITKTNVELDDKWGLDHGAWSVIKHLYPNADVPVIQMSLDYYQNPQYHYELAQELTALRHKGVLIIGSGNIVHNLRRLDWKNTDGGYDWAIEANEKMKELILDNNHKQLINYQTMGKAFELSIPTPEHYLPLLYTLGLKGDHEKTTFFNDKTVMGSISMTSLIID